MALISCPECKQELSDKATSCPHCGNPVIPKPIPAIPITQTPIATTPSKEKFALRKTVKIAVAGFCILGLIVFALFELPSTHDSMQNALSDASMFFIMLPTSARNFTNSIFNSPQLLSVASDFGKAIRPTPEPPKPLTATQTNPDGTKIYALEKDDIFGYQFYTGKIDGSGSIDIGSEAKQRIANLLKYLNFPPRLTQNLAIINIDPAVAKPSDRLNIPWGGVNATVAIQPQVGSYQGVFGGSVIALNNLTGYSLSVMTHELGHHIASQMTDAEWAQYYKLRGIPSSTPRNNSNWNLSPNEDFAEVYKNTYRQGDSPEWNIKTEYGALIPVSDFLEASTPCAFITDEEKLQDCRKNNAGANFYGSPVYTRQVSDATRQFVKNLVAKLNVH